MWKLAIWRCHFGKSWWAFVTMTCYRLNIIENIINSINDTNNHYLQPKFPLPVIPSLSLSFALSHLLWLTHKHTRTHTGIPGMLCPCRPEKKSSVYVIEAVLLLWAVIWWADNSTAEMKALKRLYLLCLFSAYMSLFLLPTPAVWWKMLCHDFDINVKSVFFCLSIIFQQQL